MMTVPAFGTSRSSRFDAVVEPFRQGDGLPFAEVLTAESIQRAFREEDALFGEHDIFSTDIVLWAFLAQTLRDGKGAACSAAVADIATYRLQIGQPPPSGDTGDYCRARAKLSLPALRRLVVESAEHLQREADPSWLWKGLHPQLVDGFTFTLPDTPENQAEFPQQKSQRPGAGFPIARACVVLSLATAAIGDLNLAAYEGKETGESALLRGMLDRLRKGDVAVFDRGFCSFMMLALLQLRGVHFCARLHQRRPIDFRQGRRLGRDDHLVSWTRPKKPFWMSEELYQQIPQTLTLREVRFQVTVPGRRTKTLTVVTSLTDADTHSPQDLAELYGYRWSNCLATFQVMRSLGRVGGGRG